MVLTSLALILKMCKITQIESYCSILRLKIESSNGAGGTSPSIVGITNFNFEFPTNGFANVVVDSIPITGNPGTGVNLMAQLISLDGTSIVSRI